MASGGMLALDGIANVSLANFMDLIDGTDAIRYWDDSILEWADIINATYGDDYMLSYLTGGDLAGYTLLTVYTPEPRADFNSDGDVDGNDFLTWQRGESPNPLSAEDLSLWQDQFGTTSSLSLSTTIPEPSSIMMILLAAFACSPARGALFRDSREDRSRLPRIGPGRGAGGCRPLPASGPR